MVATSDLMEAETVQACGAESISAEALRGLLANARHQKRCGSSVATGLWPVF